MAGNPYDDPTYRRLMDEHAAAEGDNDRQDELMSQALDALEAAGGQPVRADGSVSSGSGSTSSGTTSSGTASPGEFLTSLTLLGLASALAGLASAVMRGRLRSRR